MSLYGKSGKIVAVTFGVMASLALTSVNRVCALEGGSTSEGRAWSSTITFEQPTAEERTAELAARASAIEAEGQVKETFGDDSLAEKMQELHQALKKVVENKGWVPKWKWYSAFATSSQCWMDETG